MFKASKILVTGGAGFLGTNLILRLLSLGAKVRATLHQRPAQIQDARIEWVKADLTDLSDCHRVVREIDYIFLCAANTSGAAVMATNPLAHVTPNVVMNAQMLEAAYQARVRKLLFISSSAAYPDTGTRPATEQDMFQDDPPNVYYPVGWMKRYAEILCQTYALKIKNPMPCVVVRPSNIYGPFDKYDPSRSHVTAATIRKVAERHQPIEVWGAGEDLRDLVYVDDFMAGLLLAFQKSVPYLAVNLAAGKVYSVKEILAILLEIDGFSQATVRFDPSKPSMIPRRYIDTRFAQDCLGFQPHVTLREGLTHTLRWYRGQPNGAEK